MIKKLKLAKDLNLKYKQLKSYASKLKNGCLLCCEYIDNNIHTVCMLDADGLENMPKTEDENSLNIYKYFDINNLIAIYSTNLTDPEVFVEQTQELFIMGRAFAFCDGEYWVLEDNRDVDEFIENHAELNWKDTDFFI